MIRMTRLSDYAVMLLTQFAREPQAFRNARDMAAKSHLPLPTVRKIMKLLAHHGMLDARRGVKGGFNLALHAEKLTLADIVAAVEGGVSITKCSAPEETCRFEGLCPTRGNWRRINRIVLDALGGITLAEMTRQLHFDGAPVRGGVGRGG